jgi:DNA-binding NarL/FixJ family response regulator
MELKIAISCSNYIFGEGLKKLIEDDRDIQVVGIFNSGNGSLEDVKEILKLNPDIFLVDFSANSNILLCLSEDIPGADRPKILLIGDRSLSLLADRELKDLIIRGVVGILPPGADSDLLKKVLKAVFSGEMWLDRSTLTKLFSSTSEPAGNSPLAKREKEIVSHICQGYRNKEIAQKLNISEQTVKSHCNRIYKKLGVTDRLQLALYSYKMDRLTTKF